MKIINPQKKFSQINLTKNFPLIKNLLNDLELFFNNKKEKNILEKINELINISYKLNEKDLKKYIIFLIKDNSHFLIIEILKKIKNDKIIEKILELLIILTTEEVEIFVKNNILVYLNFLLKNENFTILGNVFWTLGNIVIDDAKLKIVYNDLFIFEEICKIILRNFMNEEIFGGFVIFCKNYFWTEKTCFQIEYKEELFELFLDFFLDEGKKNYNFYLLDILEIFDFFFDEKNKNLIFPDFSKQKGITFLKKLINLLITPKTTRSQKSIIKTTCSILKKIYLQNPKIPEKLSKTPIFKFLDQNLKNPNLQIFLSTINLLNYLLEKNQNPIILETILFNSKIIENLYSQLDQISPQNKKFKKIANSLTLLFDSDLEHLNQFYINNEFFAGILIRKLDLKIGFVEANDLLVSLKEILAVSKVFEERFGWNPVVEFVLADRGLVGKLENMSFCGYEELVQAINDIIMFYFN